MQENSSFEGSGRWCRFDRYEVRGGYIRPAPRQRLVCFDPWKRRRTDSASPYLDLVHLVRGVPKDRPMSSHLPVEKELEQAVLDWCSHYGLLGLLPHTVLSVRLGTWQLTRRGADWQPSRYPWSPDPYEKPWDEVVIDEFGDVEFTNSDYGWWYYFPEVPVEDRGAPPDSGPGRRIVPLTKEFWQHYGEPIGRVIGVARYFANAIEVINTPTRKSLVEDGSARLNRRGAVKRLDQLVSHVTQGIDVDSSGRIMRRLRSPSLLGHLALQAIRDITGERLRTCQCGRLFAMERPNQKHCSSACGNRFRVRQSRKNARVAQDSAGKVSERRSTSQ